LFGSLCKHQKSAVQAALFHFTKGFLVMQYAKRPNLKVSRDPSAKRAQITNVVAEIIGGRPVSEVWVALGGNAPKRGRARAFYREGDNPFAVSLNDSKGCWFDHRDGVGGGVLDLIQQVRGCDRRSALCWLAELNGLRLDDHPLTASGRREYGRKVAEASDLAAWRAGLIDAMKRERNRWWEIYHGSLRYLLDVGLDGPLSDVAATLHELAETQVEFWVERIETLAKAPQLELLPVFRETKARAAA
jgi:hypothetical protein